MHMVIIDSMMVTALIVGETQLQVTPLDNRAPYLRMIPEILSGYCVRDTEDRFATGFSLLESSGRQKDLRSQSSLCLYTSTET